MNGEIVCKCTELPYLYKDDTRTLLFKKINKEKNYDVRVYSPIISLYYNGEYFTKIENRDNVCLEDSERSYAILIKPISIESSKHAKFDVKIYRCNDTSNVLYHKAIYIVVITITSVKNHITKDTAVIVDEDEETAIGKIRETFSCCVEDFITDWMLTESIMHMDRKYMIT